MSYTNKQILFNHLLFTKSQTVAVPHTEKSALSVEEAIKNAEPEAYKTALMAIKNLESIGYTIDKQGFLSLINQNKDDIADWYFDISKDITASVSADKIHKPFYPNFPDDYIDHNDIQKVLDQIMHYWTGYRPVGEDKKTGIKSFEEHPLKVLKTVDINDLVPEVDKIFENLTASKMNLSNDDYYNFVIPYTFASDDWNKKVSNIENRETMCTLYSIAMMQDKSTSDFPKFVTNDVLRVAQKLSSAKRFERDYPDIDTKEEKLTALPKRYYRELIKNLATPAGVSDRYKQLNLEDDFARNKEAWKVLLQHAHIKGEKTYNSKEYDALKAAHDSLCKNSLKTYYGRVEEAFKDKNMPEVLKIYKERPGEFVKNINRILTVADKEGLGSEFMKDFTDNLKETISKVRTEDLFSLYEYLNSRTREDRMPVHNVKGNLYLSDKEYSVMPKEFVDTFNQIIVNEIKAQIRTDWSDKKVFVDPELEKMKVPGKDKSESSASTNTYTKGSIIDIEKNENAQPKNVRLFVWWTNQDKPFSSVDIDLSINLYDADKNKVASLGYSRTDGNSYGCHHSGDITDGGDFNGVGATEYIDMNMDMLKSKGIKYVAAYVNCFSGDTFNELNCQFGWMERSELDKTEQFDARAVKQKSELMAKSRGIIPIIVDVEKGNVLWLDMPDFHIQGAQNVNNFKGFDYIMDKYCNNDRMNMYELAHIAANANGASLTNDIKEADIIFSVDNYEEKEENQTVITAKNQDVWIKEFMTPKNISADKIKEKEPSFLDMLAEELKSIDNETDKDVLRKPRSIDNDENVR